MSSDDNAGGDGDEVVDMEELSRLADAQRLRAARDPELQETARKLERERLEQEAGAQPRAGSEAQAPVLDPVDVTVDPDLMASKDRHAARAHVVASVPSRQPEPATLPGVKVQIQVKGAKTEMAAGEPARRLPQAARTAGTLVGVGPRVSDIDERMEDMEGEFRVRARFAMSAEPLPQEIADKEAPYEEANALSLHRRAALEAERKKRKKLEPAREPSPSESEDPACDTMMRGEPAEPDDAGSANELAAANEPPAAVETDVPPVVATPDTVARDRDPSGARAAHGTLIIRSPLWRRSWATPALFAVLALLAVLWWTARDEGASDVVPSAMPTAAALPTMPQPEPSAAAPPDVASDNASAAAETSATTPPSAAPAPPPRPVVKPVPVAKPAPVPSVSAKTTPPSPPSASTNARPDLGGM
jgi:hypothetical protein